MSDVLRTLVYTFAAIGFLSFVLLWAGVFWMAVRERRYRREADFCNTYSDDAKVIPGPWLEYDLRERVRR